MKEYYPHYVTIHNNQEIKLIVKKSKREQYVKKLELPKINKEPLNWKNGELLEY